MNPLDAIDLAPHGASPVSLHYLRGSLVCTGWLALGGVWGVDRPFFHADLETAKTAGKKATRAQLLDYLTRQGRWAPFASDKDYLVHMLRGFLMTAWWPPLVVEWIDS